MAKWTKEQRDQLDKADFGAPESRLFPVADQADLDAVVPLVGKARGADTIKANLVAIAKRKGLKVPDAWTSGGHAGFSAEFATEAKGAPADAATVTRKADVIFKAGEYPFPPEQGGPFSMTPEEIMAACADFRDPVELEDTHAPSVFNGKIGHLIGVTPTADFNQFGGTVRIPKWFDDLFPNEPIKLSARWDRPTKRLAKLAVVPNPRITDAAMFAAFAAAEVAAAPPNGVGKPEHFSPHGRKLMQFIHDHAAVHGAACKPEASPGVKPNANFTAVGGKTIDPTTAPFHAQHELDTMQKLHDLTLGSGAACSLWKTPQGSQDKWSPGQYSQTVNEMPAYKDYQPGRYAMLSEGGTQGAGTGVQGSGASPPPSPEVQRLTAEFAVEKAQLQAKLDEAEQKRKADRRAKYLAEGAIFAKELRMDGRIYPYQEPGIAAAFAQAAMDDEASPATVTFSDAAGKTHSGTRLEQLRTSYGEQPKDPLKLRQETVPDKTVLFNRTDTLTESERELVEARRSADKFAEERNKLNGTNGQGNGVGSRRA